MLVSRPPAWDYSALIIAGTVVCAIVAVLSDSASGLDTCGSYFFVPAFPACNLFLEVVPCFNLSLAVLVTMTTAQGRELHNFSVVYGAMKELSLEDYNKDGHEGFLVRSSEALSLYVHTPLGDSMVVFPVDTYSRAYEIPRLSFSDSPGGWTSGDAEEESTTSSPSSSSSSSSSDESNSGDSDAHHTAEYQGSSANNGHGALQTNLSATLFIVSSQDTNVTVVSSLDESFWDFPNSSFLSSTSILSSSSTSTTITSSQLDSSSSLSSSSAASSSSSSSSSSSTQTQSVIKLEAFQLYKFPINSSLVYQLYSDKQFAVVLVQTSGVFSQDGVLCQDAKLKLLDFVPPFSRASKMFYLALFDATQFVLFIAGRMNTTLDIITDKDSKQVKIDQSGRSFVHVTSTTAAWMSASHPVTLYVRLNMCNDSSRDHGGSRPENVTNSATSASSSPSPSLSSLSTAASALLSPSLSTSSSSSSSSSSTSSRSNSECAENGFFLPSVDSYMTCKGNKTKDSSADCECRCPSVFQRDLNPLTFLTGQGLNLTRPATSGHSDHSAWDRPGSSVYPLLVGELYDVSTFIVREADFRDAFDVIVNTNTSFLVFRQDFLNLNFLPAGMSLGGSGISEMCEEMAAKTAEAAMKTDFPFLNAACTAGTTPATTTVPPAGSACVCELSRDVSALFSSASGHGQSVVTSYSSGKSSSVNLQNVPNVQTGGGGGGGDIFFWEEDQEDTTRPLIAVVVSLCVAIFAVIALISGYMLVEMVSRRKHVRNTKIRPFVS